MRKALGFIFLSTLSFTDALAQSVVYDEEVARFYSEGIAYFDLGNYESANISFRKALATNEVLPTNLSYYFAETLYQIKQYQNSINFVDKYLDLAGRAGDFYEEAVFLKSQIEKDLIAIRECDRCDNFGYRLIPCQRCGATGIETAICFQCRGTGNTLCPKCTGKGVYITLDKFGQPLYETCDRCGGDGIIICTLCHGAKILTTICSLCLGSKYQSSDVLCNHQDEQPELLELDYH